LKKKAFLAALPFTIPIFFGYLFSGIAFGILLTSHGHAWWWAPVMAVVILAGSMQFIALEILAAPFNPLMALVMTLMVNARHMFYGLSMFDKFRNAGVRKPYQIYALTDETYSVLCEVEPPEGVDRDWFNFFVAALNQSYWVGGCTLGALAGSAFRFNTKGIDFVLTALFLVIFLSQWESTRDHRPALIGVGCAVLALLLFGPDNFILPSMIGIFLLMVVLRKPVEASVDHE